jgi:hypothetical protein
MKYQLGEIISLGDRVTYNGQKGRIALIGSKSRSGCRGIRRADWIMNDSQILVLFDNGARLMLDNPSEDNLLVFCRQR